MLFFRTHLSSDPVLIIICDARSERVTLINQSMKNNQIDAMFLSHFLFVDISASFSLVFHSLGGEGSLEIESIIFKQIN